MWLWKIARSFWFASRGIFVALGSERNMKIHLSLAILALLAGGFLRISHHEWLAVFLAMGLVFCAEMFNTVIEHLVGGISPENSVTARRVKDMAAGAVLMASMSALAVAFMIYPKKILEWLCATLQP